MKAVLVGGTAPDGIDLLNATEGTVAVKAYLIPHPRSCADSVFSKDIGSSSAKTITEVQRFLKETERAEDIAEGFHFCLHSIEIRRPDAKSAEMMIHVVRAVHSATSTPEEDSVFDTLQFLYFQLPLLQGQHRECTSSVAGYVALGAMGTEEILRQLNGVSLCKNAKLLFLLSLDMKHPSATKWLRLCQRWITCRRDIRIGACAGDAVSNRLEMEILKSTILHLTGTELTHRKRNSELRDQLEQIHDRIRDLSQECSKSCANGSDHASSFEASLGTLDLWMQLRTKQAHNLEVLEGEVSDLKSKIQRLEGEREEQQETLDNMAFQKAEYGTHDEQRQKELQTLRQELAAAQSRDQENAALHECLKVRKTSCWSDHNCLAVRGAKPED